jgi:hypothetical protein
MVVKPSQAKVKHTDMANEMRTEVVDIIAGTMGRA